jgi:4-amino-4-deoxy-L-arabinose transferase-like glycosyltransferase
MATTRPHAGRAATPVRLAVRIPYPRWAFDAWMSIAVVALFLGITFWWLTQDRSIPVFDAGVRLSQAIIVYEHLRSGSVGAALTTTSPYPPFSYLVGAIGLWMGGLGVAQPIVAQNLVFVPLLALGCYNVGRLAFGSPAGLLAVVFALGSPLITAQFHVSMVDAPETAMVAVSVWLILASERFSRVWISAAAGAAVGLGLLTKEPFVFFVGGVVLVTLARGGWRAWRGLAAFAIVALALALPWYVSEFSRVHELAQGVATNQNATLGSSIAPPRWSITNLTWYFSNILNQQVYAPLFVFAAIGSTWTIAGLVRRRPISPLSWELVIGAAVGWLGITATFPHDTRYSMPLLVYLAVLGSGWIVRLARPWRLAATSALVLIAAANTLSTSFGLGTLVSAQLPKPASDLLKIPSSVTIYSNKGFLVSAPHRDGDVLGLMRALQRNGVRQVTWISLGPKEPPPGFTSDFSEAGLTSFTLITKLATPSEEVAPGKLTQHDATLGHGPIKPGEPPPCTKLSDGTGVWVRLGNPSAPGAKNYCPFRHPAFY